MRATTADRVVLRLTPVAAVGQSAPFILVFLAFALTGDFVTGLLLLAGAAVVTVMSVSYRQVVLSAHGLEWRWFQSRVA